GTPPTGRKPGRPTISPQRWGRGWRAGSLAFLECGEEGRDVALVHLAHPLGADDGESRLHPGSATLGHELRCGSHSIRHGRAVTADEVLFRLGLLRRSLLCRSLGLLRLRLRRLFVRRG